MFETAAGNVAEFISRGFNGTEIGDKLEDLAVQVGARLDDVDARQGIIAAAILKAANGHKPLLTSRAKFLADFVAPDYLVDGIIQRRSLYALTGPTGGGKTALALELTSAVARICDRATFGGHNVEGGRVVYFVGENPDDVRARIVGADYYRNDGPSTDRVHFIVGVFKIEEIRERVAQEAETLGGVHLVIIDTSAAYFPGDNENDNVQMGNYARTLRTLTKLPGGPCVVPLCHPTKTVTDPAFLLPRGGGAFLNELDGNLTTWKRDEDIVELHHGKLRGPGFEPVTFRLDRITALTLVDSKGRTIPTVSALAVSEQEEAERARDNRKDEDRLLLALYENADRSQRDLARACDFMMKTGEPGISKVQRVADRLKAVKLVKNGRGRRWKLTKEGESNAKKLKGAEDDQRVEDRGGTASSKPFSAVKDRKCSKDVPCIHCHMADGNVYKIKDGRLRNGQGHYEALHEGCAENWFTGKASPKTPSAGTQGGLDLRDPDLPDVFG